MMGKLAFMNKYNAPAVAFTLIEVLLALVIIAISLTALLRATGQDIRYTQRLKNKSVRHWVAKQAINKIQSNLIIINATRTQTFKTTMLNQDWFWRVAMLKTKVVGVSKIRISVSEWHTGPFTQALTAYKLTS